MRELLEMSCTPSATRRAATSAPKNKSGRRKSENEQGDRDAGKKGMRHGVGHERQPAQHDECAQHTIGEADERATEQVRAA